MNMVRRETDQGESQENSLRYEFRASSAQTIPLTNHALRAIVIIIIFINFSFSLFRNEQIECSAAGMMFPDPPMSTAFVGPGLRHVKRRRQCLSCAVKAPWF